MVRPISDDSVGARLARFLHSGSGYCGRCGRPWAEVKPHVTDYSTTSGCFALCEECWTVLVCAEARIEYYKDLIDWWSEIGSPISEETRRDIGRAVANGG